jgi:hypothetical protein
MSPSESLPSGWTISPSSSRLSRTTGSFVPPHSLAAFIAGASSIVPISFL